MIVLPNAQISSDIRTYLDNLLEDAGMVLTDELKESMIQDLNVRLEKKLIADALDNMNPEKVEEFIKLLQAQANSQQVDSFIKEHVPNAQELFTKSLVDFRDYFLKGTAKDNATPDGQVF